MRFEKSGTCKNVQPGGRKATKRLHATRHARARKIRGKSEARTCKARFGKFGGETVAGADNKSAA